MLYDFSGRDSSLIFMTYLWKKECEKIVCGASRMKHDGMSMINYSITVNVFNSLI